VPETSSISENILCRILHRRIKQSITIALHKAKVRFDLQALQKEAHCIFIEEKLPYGIYF